MAGDAKEKMIASAAKLLATRGLQASSFAEVLAASGAPRGSIYHHFPEGKDQLVSAALGLVSKRAQDFLETKAGAPAREITSTFLGMWRELLTRSQFTAGCAVVAVTVAADSPELLEQTAAIFGGWKEQLARLLHEGGIAKARAERFATTLLAASEGAVVLSRAAKSLEPFEAVAADLIEDAARLSKK